MRNKPKIFLVVSESSRSATKAVAAIMLSGKASP